MSFHLDATYGKQSVPVFKVVKHGKKHTVIDMQVKIMLEGNVKDSWLTGENHQIVPTETQKNTCYALALQTDFDCAEDYGIALGNDMLARHKHIDRVKLEIAEKKWDRVKVFGSEHNHSFQCAKDATKNTCFVEVTRHGATVSSGVCDVNLMKTTQSGFKGFIQDKYTNLQPVGAGSSSPDRIMCTQLTTNWKFSRKPASGYAVANKAIFQTLLENWAGPPEDGRFSKSVQETAYIMATAVLDQFPEVESVYLATPNIHHYTYPLEQFGMKNPNVVFQSTDCHTTASGRIETRVSRTRSKL
eukprot:m.24935 g.24935  ORF g.24935 m.24935 type:complete len:301 (-) comp11284_c0_seq1:316-1218(-)